jgi:hypothetical protein
MSNTPAIRAGPQLSLNTTTPNRKARTASKPTTARWVTARSLHSQRLQRRPGHKKGKDNHGRPKPGESLRKLHEDPAHGEQKRRHEDHCHEPKRIVPNDAWPEMRATACKRVSMSSSLGGDAPRPTRGGVA